MKTEVEIYRDTDLSTMQITEILRLSHSVWPDPTRNVAERVEELSEYIKENQELVSSTRRLVIWEADRAIAIGKTFPRKIHVLNSKGRPNEDVTVLALSGVCAASDYRGSGLGAAIVKAAFGSLTKALPVTLFQTGVPAFYEKLGARLVDNRFVDYQNLEDPMANPWREDYVMIYPACQQWWKSTIDLNGPAW
jgi:predicted N-acetyltransferase YhbS